MNKKGTVIAFLLAVLCLSFRFPDDPVKRINQVLNKFFKWFPQEKIHLLLDKQTYSPGDIIWLHGYAFNTASVYPISKIAYVELIGSDQKIITKLTLPVDSSGMSGSIDLPLELKPGNYYIRAYTAWMLNFNPAFLFYRKINILAGAYPGVNQDDSLLKKDFTVQFFPEGGNLVQRLTSLVAFKATNEDGLPVNISGKVTDSDGATVALLQTLHDGMGKFAIHCSSKKNYTATVTWNGITKTFPLPAAAPSGIVLYTRHETDSLNDYLYFHLSRSILEKEKFEDLILCAQMENHVTFSRIRFDEKTAGDPVDTILEANSYLPLNGFPPGVLHLTVFNDSAEPLAERLLFLNPQHLRQRITFERQDNVVPHGQNEIALAVPENFKGSFSVSVTDDDGLAENRGSLLSDYFLSDLEGYIHRPSWYFDAINAEKLNALDLLLMTRKWSRFNWKDLLNNKFREVRYEPQQSIILKGQAFLANKEGKTPYRNKEIVMVFNSPKDSLNQFINVPIDSTGHFSLDGFNFHDTASLYVYNEGDKKILRKVSVEFSSNMEDTVIAPAFTEETCPANSFFSGNTILNSPGIRKANSQHSDSILRTKNEVLDNVTVRAKPKNYLDSLLSRYASGPFANPNAPAETFDFTDEKQAPLRDWQTVFDYTRNKIKGLEYFFDGEKNEYIIVWRMSSSLLNNTISESERYRSNAPAFFLNEILLNDAPEQYTNAYQTITSLNMSQVALIRVFQPGSLPVVPNNSPHGAIVIYTKNGTELSHQSPQNQITFDKAMIRGYSRVKNFNSVRPVASLAGNKANKGATRYWNNNLPVDSSDHRVKFSFYNNPMAKKLRVVVEGIDTNGNLLYDDKIIEQ